MKRTLSLLLPATVLALLVLAGCAAATGTSGATAGATTAGAATASPMSSATASVTITIKNYGFLVSGPVDPGERITVRNDDNVAHTVTADADAMFNVTVPASATATFTAPDKAGSYPFHCDYHAEMHGTLIVR